MKPTTIYLIKCNGNPMAATLDETIVEALLSHTRAHHWEQNRNNPKYSNNYGTYQLRCRWSRQSLPISLEIPAQAIPMAPPSHNPSPVQPRGTQQILPNQQQAHRIQPQTVPTALPALVDQFRRGVITEGELYEKAALIGYTTESVDDAIRALPRSAARPATTTPPPPPTPVTPTVTPADPLPDADGTPGI